MKIKTCTMILFPALCKGRTDNVVLLDWSRYSSINFNYTFSAQNAQKVGSLFARSIRLLLENGLNVSRIYPIGFSLGADIASIAAKCNSDYVIPRITGMSNNLKSLRHVRKFLD